MKYYLMEYGKWHNQQPIRQECNYLAEQLEIGSSIYVKRVGLIYINAFCFKSNGDKIYIYDRLAG